MTTPFWCLLFVAVMPYLLAGLGGYLRVQQLGGLDAEHPRVQALELRGAAARAYAAQQNAWEAVALFGTAVFLAHFTGANPGSSATASLGFVATRVLHPVFYVANVPMARTLVFVAGLGCCIWLFVLAATA